MRTIEPSPISVRFHEHRYVPTAFRHLPSRTLHYPGSVSPGHAEQRGRVRGSQTVQPPDPRLPGRGRPVPTSRQLRRSTPPHSVPHFLHLLKEGLSLVGLRGTFFEL